MKQTRIITIILLTVLILGGWLSAVFGTGDKEKEAEYESHIVTAEDYFRRGLYQRSIQEYEAAIAIKNQEDTWIAMLQAYQNRFEENEDSYDSYLGALQTAVSTYTQNAEFVVTLAELYIEEEDYKSAYKCLCKALDAGIEDKEIESMKTDVQYAFVLDWVSYIDYTPCCNGYYSVNDNGVWKYIAEDGTSTKLEDLKLAGSVGEAGVRVICDEQSVKLIDDKEIVQGIISFTPDESGIYAEGLIPLKNENGYSYYDLLGDKQFGRYDCAGTFINGKAAVQEDGGWKIVNSEGESVSEETYVDIKLNIDGTYLKNGVMLADKDGHYSLFDENEKQISKFSCDDMDVITENGWIAFLQGEKWGYVDCEGNVMLLPTYEKAKSFSNGLAAVCRDDKWGFIDSSGEVVIDYQFLDVGYFTSKGTCMVKTTSETWQLISLYITN